ncbi:MAG: cupin domain-containing protein [Thermoplasmata archaeon]|nr:cupin domain-containing protein [Thermoplasmata archaeon]
MADSPSLNPFELRKENIDKFIEASTNHIIRREEDMIGFFKEAADTGKLIYDVYEIEGPHSTDMGLTIMKPGKVGREYHMTKGHFHESGSADEYYFCLSGKGLILLQSAEGELRHMPLDEGGGVYVPPGWAHRTVNVGNDDFILLAIFPKDAGHDYGTIKEKGFGAMVVEVDGKYAIVDNPN